MVGLLLIGLVAYMLLTGEVAVDRQRSMTITRAGNPFVYWPIVGVGGAIGALALRAAWRRLNS